MTHDNNKTTPPLPDLSYPCFPAHTTSLAGKCLTEKIFNQLVQRKTSSGFTLSHALRSGILNPDSSMGIYAGDPESYNTFAKIFTPVIEDYHSLKLHSQQGEAELKQSGKLHDSKLHTDFSTGNFPKHKFDLSNPDPENRYIISTRIRIARNLSGFPFTPFIPLKKRKQVEQSVIHALSRMPPEFKGVYRSMEQHHSTSFFKKGDRFQEEAGINRHWPEARGVFESEDGTFIVWINEEDHLRIISLYNSGDISNVFNRLARGVTSLEKHLSFAWRPDLGYLAACPSNLGTGMRAGVHIKLPGLFKKKEHLKNAAKELKLQIRGTQGEKTEVESAVFDISNSQRLGISEQTCCETLCSGISKIIEMEKSITS